MEKAQKVLVVGATGGTGRATIDALVKRGHRVTAFSRHAESLENSSDRVTLLNGDATNPDDVERAVAGHDAVIITLGITENPLRVRLFGAARTPLDVRSAGTRNVIAAMRKHGVRRLVVQSSYGVGETRRSLRWVERMFFSLLLKPQIADTEVQELEVRESGAPQLALGGADVLQLVAEAADRGHRSAGARSARERCRLGARAASAPHR
jgi:nucleoside-diphosphate-sugar epimerase